MVPGVQRETAGHGLNVPGVAPRNLMLLTWPKHQGRAEDSTALPDPRFQTTLEELRVSFQENIPGTAQQLYHPRRDGVQSQIFFFSLMIDANFVYN